MIGFLAVCIDYLYRNREGWGKDVAVGKTLVSSALIDRVVADLGRELCEVPVGFKWKKEPPKGSDVSRFKRKRMNVKLDSATYTLVKLVATKTTKKEVEYTYVLYKSNNYTPKQQMDYLFMQDAHK